LAVAARVLGAYAEALAMSRFGNSRFSISRFSVSRGASSNRHHRRRFPHHRHRLL
jgi:hypothetical protein